MTSRVHTTESLRTARPSPEPELDERVAEALSSTLSAEWDPPLIALTSRDACPVYQIGAQIGRLVAEHSRQDHTCLAAPSDSEEYREHDRLMERAQRSIDLLQGVATDQQATSLEGALAQVIVAHAYAIEIDENSDLDETGRADRVSRVSRLLHSIAKVLSASTVLSPRVLGSDYSMPASSDTLGMAWAMPRSSDIVPGDKPTVDDAPAAVAVEQQLVALNEAATAWWKIYEDAGDLQNEAEGNAAEPGAAVRYRMAEMAEAHSIRITRSNLIRAMELPAATAREFGLQARLIAVELNEWWDDDKLAAGEKACRQLLTRLIALAGLAPIPRKDLNVEEAQAWVGDPLAFAGTFGRDPDIDPRFNRALPDSVQRKDA